MRRIAALLASAALLIAAPSADAACLIKHVFTSAIPDGPDPTQIQPSNWNDCLRVVNGAPGQYLLFDPTDATYGVKWAPLTAESFALAGLPTPATVGRLARVTDASRGLWMDTGSQWVALSGGVVNVREYGAKGDDATDDTAAINAAITAAPSGAVVFFPEGTYAITSPLVVRKSLMLAGVGHGSVIKIKSGSTPVPPPDLQGGGYVPIIWIRSDSVAIDRVTITRLQLDGNRTGSTQSGDGNPGIKVEAATFALTKVWISELHIRRVNGDGITVMGCCAPYSFLPTDVWIERNAIEDWRITRQGVAVTSGRRVAIRGNHFFNHPVGVGYAIDLEPDGSAGENVSQISISGNVIDATASDGVNTTDRPPAVVEKVLVDGNLINSAANPLNIAAGTGVVAYGNSVGTGAFAVWTNSTTRLVLGASGRLGLGGFSDTSNFEIRGLVPSASLGLVHLRPPAGSASFVTFTEDAVADRGALGFPAASNAFQIITSGNVTTGTVRLAVNLGVTIGAPTGGDQGAGTLNLAAGLYANGTAGLSVTTTVRDAAGTGTCTLIFTVGLKTGGTC